MTSESQEPTSSTSTRKRRPRKQVAATERTGKRYLGEILIANGAITEDELNVALAQQNSTGGRLGEVLLTLKLVRATDLLKAVAEQNSVEFIDLDTITMDPDLLGPMTSGRCRRLNAVPVKRNPDGDRPAGADRCRGPPPGPGRGERPGPLPTTGPYPGGPQG